MDEVSSDYSDKPVKKKRNLLIPKLKLAMMKRVKKRIADIDVSVNIKGKG